jgi:hypothetical protein
LTKDAQLLQVFFEVPSVDLGVGLADDDVVDVPLIQKSRAVGKQKPTTMSFW